MPSLLQYILMLLMLLYAAVQLAVLIVLVIHHLYVRQGKPGLLAARWSYLDLWVGFHLALLITLGALVGLAFAAGFVLAILSPEDGRAFQRAVLMGEFPDSALWWMVFPILLVQNAAFVAAAVLYMVGKYGMDLRTLGLVWDRQAVRIGLLWGVLAFLVTPLVELLSVGVLRLMLGASGFERLVNWEKQTVAIEAILESLQPGIMLAAFVLTVAVVAPIGEEIFFRGFVFNLLRNRLNLQSAVWISSALFAVLHVSVKNFLPILVIGVLLARLYHRTGSLWSCMVMHGMFNLLSTVAAIVTGRI